MLDIKQIIDNLELVKDSIKKRSVNIDLEQLLELNVKRKSFKTTLDQLRQQANQVAKKIPIISQVEKPALIQEGKKLNQEINELQHELSKIEQDFEELMLKVPNFLATDTPIGTSDDDNVVLKTYLTPKKFDFTLKDHVTLAQNLDLIDFEAGAKVTGSKFYFLKNAAVLLEQALKLYVTQLVMKQGYTPLITPDLAKKSILHGTGFSPRGEESNIYNLEEVDLSLIATAEITVGGLHSDEILLEDQLPLKYVAQSHCFRREAGSAGRESKGLYRVHQFTKIELFQITTPQTSDSALQEILALEEEIYQQLELPYRIMRICTGDMSAPAYKKYDIEVWMPGRDSEEKYGEVTSCSNCTDFQSRRLNIKYRTPDNNKIYPHTLNGTAIALSRTILAILENYQQSDGSIIIPKILQPLMEMELIKVKN